MCKQVHGFGIFHNTMWKTWEKVVNLSMFLQFVSKDKGVGLSHVGYLPAPIYEKIMNHELYRLLDKRPGFQCKFL